MSLPPGRTSMIRAAIMRLNWERRKGDHSELLRHLQESQKKSRLLVSNSNPSCRLGSERGASTSASRTDTTKQGTFPFNLLNPLRTKEAWRWQAPKRNAMQRAVNIVMQTAISRTRADDSVQVQSIFHHVMSRKGNASGGLSFVRGRLKVTSRNLIVW